MNRRSGPPWAQKGDDGFSLVAAVAGITVMFIMMGAAVPSWKYVMKDAREEELLFRGIQILEAIKRYQDKNANTAPPSLEVLVKGKFLRKPYKDPMTKDGKWRFIRQGEAIAPIGPPGGGGGPSPSPSPSASSSPQSSGPGVSTGTPLGAIVGVASTSKEKSLRIFNGRTRYNEWLFIAGQPHVVGRHPGLGSGGPGGVGQSPSPSPSPSPSVSR